MAFITIDDVECAEDAAVYAEVWQSWSPTRWVAAAGSGPRPQSADEGAMRFRPGCPPPATGHQGEGLLVVDPGAGLPVRRYGVASAQHTVASIRAQLTDGRLVVSTDADDVVEASESDSREQALTEFAGTFAARAGVAPLRQAPTAWCSWYHYFEEVTPADVLENLEAIERERLPVQVVQLDDGWQAGVGEWRENSKFGDLAPLVDAIRGTGRRAGIWLAPFIATSDGGLARAHPEWLVGDAGHNWGSALRGLDLHRPDVRDHLWHAFHRLAQLGFDYFKLDFLYGGALGVTPSDPQGVAGYRAGLELIRDAVGPDAYLVGCGAPLLPSVGLVDAMRVSSDTFHVEGRDGSTGLRGEAAVTARAWQHGRFWTNDADCLVLRPSFPLRERWAQIVRRVGGLRSFSDRIAELDDWGIEQVRDLLGTPPAPTPFEEAGIR